MKMLQLFFTEASPFFPKNFESLFNTLLGQDSLLFDDIGWWSGFNKGGDIIYGVNVGLHGIVEGIGTNNRVAPSHGVTIGSFIILVGGGRIE